MLGHNPDLDLKGISYIHNNVQYLKLLRDKYKLKNTILKSYVNGT
jgi:hypothetical protein